MDASAGSPVVESIPSDELETRLVRWIAQLRLGWTVAGLATAVVERRHYRRPRLAALTALVSIGDATWTVTRSDRRDDVPGVVVGTAVSTAAVVATSAAVGASDQYGGLVDWAFHAMLLTAGLTPFRTKRLALGAAITAVPMAAYVATVTARADGNGWFRACANGVQISAFFGTAAVLSRTLRRSGHAIVEAQSTALAEASLTAVEHARTEAMAELHSGARTALIRTRDLLAHDRPAARRVAAAEAARLRHAVVARGRADDGLVVALARLAERTALSGGHVELVPDLDDEPTGPVTRALVDAADTALDWLSSDGQSVRCVLRVIGGDEGIELTIRQRHLGESTELDELTRSLMASLVDVAGSIEVSAPASSGIRISMRVP